MKTSIATLTVGLLLASSPGRADVAKPELASLEAKTPSVVKAAKPVYPEMARTFRLEGEVIVNVVVDHRGVPTNAAIVKSSSPVFSAAVLNTVRAWRFSPATTEGASRVVQIPFTFKMK